MYAKGSSQATLLSHVFSLLWVFKFFTLYSCALKNCFQFHYDPSHMLHGAGIFININPQNRPLCCRWIYQISGRIRAWKNQQFFGTFGPPCLHGGIDAFCTLCGHPDLVVVSRPPLREEKLWAGDAGRSEKLEKINVNNNRTTKSLIESNCYFMLFQ